MTRLSNATNRRRGLALLLLFIAATPPAFAQLPSTKLTTIYPPGGKQGTAFDATISGTDLDEVDRLVFSHPGITAKQKTNEATEFKPASPVVNQFSLLIAADVPPGNYEARAIGRYGASNPRLFRVGTLDELVDDGSNKKIDSPREITFPVTVNGIVDANTRDYYKVTLKQNQRIIVECAAERIDSRLDATLAIYDVNGRELSRNRDSIGMDPLIDFTAPSDGQFVIALYDYVYRGGAEYFYRLSVHSAPYVDFIFPPAGKGGAASQFTIYGRNLPGGQPDANVTVGGRALEKLVVTVNLPVDEASLQKRGTESALPLYMSIVDGMDYQLSTPQGSSNSVTIGYANDPIIIEVEPNESPEKAQEVSVPCEIAGQFYPARDIDWVQFEAKQNEVYWIEVISHRLGFDCDPYFLLQRVTKNEKGEVQVSDIANIDDLGDRNARLGQDYDTSTDDPKYRFQVPQDATYRIAIRDQFNSLGPDARRVYRLLIRKEQPGFRLVAMPTFDGPINANVVNLLSPVIRKGGTLLINVRAEREDGFDGEIEINIEGLPGDVTCNGATIGGAVSTATLVIAAADNAAAWNGPIRVVGKAKINDKDVTRTAWNGNAVWNTANRQQDPPRFRATQDLMLGVIDKETAVALVETGENKVWETSRGGKLEIPLKVTRRGDFKANVVLAPFGNPAEIKPANVTVAADKADGILKVDMTNGNLKPGVYTFCLKSDVKFKYKRNTDAIKAAEAEQKRLDELVKQYQTKQQEATAAKTKATQVAQAATTELTKAQQAKTAAENDAKAAEAAAKQSADKLTQATDAAAKDPQNQALATAKTAAESAKSQADAKLKAAQEKLTAAQKTLGEAEANSKTATDAKTAAETASTEADAKLKTVQDLKKQADTNLTNTKNQNKEADRTVSLYSSPVKFRVVNSPIDLTAQAPTAAVKQGEKAEIPVTVGRKYGFDDQVQIIFEPPKGVAGLSVKTINIAKGQPQGKLEVVAAKNATPGEHTITVRARVKFNNVNNIDTTQQIVLKVEEVKEAK